MIQYIVKFKNKKGAISTFTNFSENEKEAKRKTMLMYKCKKTDIIETCIHEKTTEGLT